MRKTYQMILALALIMLGATNAMGQKIYQAELDKSMFKAWDGCGADAKEVANPDPIDVTAENPSGVAFNCDYNLFTEVGDWSGIFGSSAAYYLWYADITGTQKMHFKGSAGFKFWVQFNRQAPVEGGDAHGSDMVQQELTIGDDGTCTYEIPSDMTYVHLNCIKTKGSGVRGLLRSIVLEGTVKPVTGILPMISNGDAEGDDLSSFPVSYDGPNNGSTANDKPEIVAGVGVNGSKAFKVVSYPDPTETWHTQFYVKSDEVLPKGTKWALKMSIKAERNTKITTSAQAAPRSWLGGFINEFAVTTDWQEYTWSGEIGVDGFQSIAFDLNNGDERNADDTGWLPGNGTCGFFFDNIEFGVDLGGANPMSEITTAYGGDAIRINLANKTNMKKLVEASKVQMMVEGSPMKTLVYPNDCATVTWNGKQCNIISVEGRADGNLYVFLLDMDGEGGTDFEAEDADVKVSFKNPDDAALHLAFTEGKWEGEPVPDFDSMNCDYVYELSEGANGIFSYMWGAPTVQKVEPEDGSFNLPADMKEFTVTFSQKVDVTTVVAKLGNEALTVSPAEGEAKTITLTRTGAGDLAGVSKLVISHAVGEKGYDLEEAIVLKYSFGPTSLDGDDQPEVIMTDGFAEGGEGWIVNSGGTMQPANSGGGCRIITNGANEGMGYTPSILYLGARADGIYGYAIYGLGDKKLTLDAKVYTLSVGAARWDGGDNARQVKVQVYKEEDLDADGNAVNDAPIAERTMEITAVYKTSKDVNIISMPVNIAETGNYVIKITAANAQGNPASWNDASAIGDIKLEYIPDVMGLVEMKALAEALDKAKASREENSDSRYDGAVYTALTNLIEEYDGATMTAPSAYNQAVTDLNAAIVNMTNYRALCNEYDKLPEQAFDIYYSKKDTKFNVTELFIEIKNLVEKYCTVESQTVIDDNGNEVTTDVVTGIMVVKGQAELEAAIAELSNPVKLGNLFFTEGKSNLGDSGIKVLVDRLRYGAETLKSLGVADDDPIFEAINNAMDDDDALAEVVKKRVKLALFEQLKNADNTLFTPVVDEVTEEVTNPTLDMSVFAKNPNIYAKQVSKNFSEENVPGWTVPFGSPGLFANTTWQGERNIAGLPEDCAFTVWYSNACMEQTVVDLPAGIYTISFKAVDWLNRENSSDNYAIVEGFAYAKTSDTPAVEEGAEEDKNINFAGYEMLVGGAGFNQVINVPNIVVTDGKLTFGVQFKDDSQYFFSGINLLMTGAATGFDYAKAYDEVLTGIDVTALKPSQVRRIELFDLNGRRLSVARKGITIVKKHMSDGTVKTEKVVVK